MTQLDFLRQDAAKGHAVGHNLDANRVLLVAAQPAKGIHKLGKELGGLDDLGHVAQVGRRRPPHHGNLIRAQGCKEGADRVLLLAGHARVNVVEQKRGRDASSVPVLGGQRSQKGAKVFGNVLRRHGRRHQVDRLDRRLTYKRFLHGCQQGQGAQ